LANVVNVRMAVREWDGGVVFTHRVEVGASDRSYGIHVARLAGVPRDVVRRAEEILTNLESDEYGRDGLPRRARRTAGEPQPERAQPSLFAFADTDPREREIVDALRRQEPERLTPIEALNLLAEWKKRLSEE
jgi:DNA mismatch repair protein MutS